MLAPNPINKKSYLQFLNITGDICSMVKQKEKPNLIGETLKLFENIANTKLECPLKKVGFYCSNNVKFLLFLFLIISMVLVDSTMLRKTY